MVSDSAPPLTIHTYTYALSASAIQFTPKMSLHEEYITVMSFDSHICNMFLKVA